MQFNSAVGDYTYGTATQVGANGRSIHGHAPGAVFDTTLTNQVFTFDANGNMTAGLHGKTMTYDGENRPLSVVNSVGDETRYVYAADGERLKVRVKKAGETVWTVTAYVNGTEIRNFGDGAAQERMLNHIMGDVRLTDESAGRSTHYLHADQLGSIIGISKSDGGVAEQRQYHPFGVIAYSDIQDLSLVGEDKGFLGERYDEHAELQFLNNRYYDPELALFIQPDWLGVTEQGVGTNRYAYASNDPVNKFDPEGNSWLTSLFGFIVGALTGQPWIVAALTTGFDTAIALGNGATLGEALTSAAIQMAIATMVHGLPDVGEAGLFGGGGATTSVAKGEYISISTRGRGGFWKWGKGGIGRQSKVTGLYGDEIDSAGITFLKSGKLPEHIKTPTYVSRGQALKAARIDAGITRADKFDVVREVYTNKWGKVVLDDLGAPIMTRNYVYTQRGIIIQEHPAHFFGHGVNGNIGAHFNVRPLDNLRHGIVRGTKPHYDWGLVAK